MRCFDRGSGWRRWPGRPAGVTRRRLALSSSVRSIHCVACVWAALAGRFIANRARLQIRSARIGLRLYAIAEEPIWSFSNGSSISLRWARNPQIGGRLVSTGGDAGERVEHLGVDFSRIGLAGDRVGGIEAHFFGDQLLELADFVVIAVKQLQKAGLRAGRSFHAAGLERARCDVPLRPDRAPDRTPRGRPAGRPSSAGPAAGA